MCHIFVDILHPLKMLTSHSKCLWAKQAPPQAQNHPCPSPDPAPALGNSPPAVIPSQKAGKVDHLAIVLHGISSNSISPRTSPLLLTILDVIACLEHNGKDRQTDHICTSRAPFGAKNAFGGPQRCQNIIFCYLYIICLKGFLPLKPIKMAKTSFFAMTLTDFRDTFEGSNIDFGSRNFYQSTNNT